MEWETISWLICLQMHVQTQRPQLCHHTISLLLPLPLSLHPFPAHVPSLSASTPPSSSLTPSPRPSPLKICMQSDEITQAYTCARRTHPPLIWMWIVHSHHSHTHVCAYSTLKTQAYFQINNACWSYCSQSGREEEKARGGRCTLFHKAGNFLQNWDTQQQLGGDDPL